MREPVVRSLNSGPWLCFGRIRDFELREVTMPGPVGASLLHVTDLHFRDSWHEGYDRLLALTPQLAVDAVCLTGDWVEDKFDHRPAMPTLRRFAERLVTQFPGRVFTCLGNHDGDLLAPHLVDLGVGVLLNEYASLDGRFTLIGLAGVAREDTDDADLERLARQTESASGNRVVLVHYPDAIRRVASLRPHLTLAGHTHGGQVCMPRARWRERGGRALITHDSLDKSHSQGLHCVDGLWLHVGRGFGCSAIEVRAFCPPEVTIVRFQET
jgi:predicted MPP superfamily phosphohydrolase